MSVLRGVTDCLKKAATSTVSFRYAAPVVLGVALAPLVVMGLSSPPASSALCYSAKRVLSQNDITYLGAIRMPVGTDTTFAAGGMSGRMVNGKVHLFVYGNHTGDVGGIADPVYEIEDPGGGYSTQYLTAPQAKLVTNWGDIYQGKRTSWDSTGATVSMHGTLYPDGLYWNDSTGLLYWTYNDIYNVDVRPDWGLGATSLNDPTSAASTAYGPWRTVAKDADGKSHYGPWRCLYMFSNPADGSMMCGSTIQSGNSGSPWGPDAYGGRPWPTTGTPSGFTSPDLSFPARYLEYYFMGDTSASNYIDSAGAVHGKLRSFRRNFEQALWEDPSVCCPSGAVVRVNPALNKGVGSWSDMDTTTGAIWLELNNTRGVIFSNVLAGAVSQDPTDCVNAAHEWYSNAGVHPPVGACSHGCPPPVQVTGSVSTAAFPAFTIFNPDDLLGVKSGAQSDYAPIPNNTIDLANTYHIKTAPEQAVGAADSIAGFYFDPVRNYLFAVSVRADDSQGSTFVQSLIHVFAINDAPAGGS